jgi:pimeloyl-ACP methyl ester carboxylesterase
LFIDIDGIRTSYTDVGEGNPLLVLHGWGCNASVYASLTERFSERYRVVLPELPGFGESAEPLKPGGVDDYAVFVTAFCKAVGINKTSIFAHSLGCRIAIKLLSDAECPVQFDRVAFTGAAGIKPTRSLKSAIRVRAYKTGRAVMSAAPMKKLFPNAVENMRNKTGSADYRAASPIMRQCLVKIVNEDLRGFLPLIKRDVLLIWGENDDQTPLSDGQLMEKLIDGAGLAVIKGAGHYAFLEQPQLFGRITDAYFEG